MVRETGIEFCIVNASMEAFDNTSLRLKIFSLKEFILIYRINTQSIPNQYPEHVTSRVSVGEFKKKKKKPKET